MSNLTNKLKNISCCLLNYLKCKSDRLLDRLQERLPYCKLVQFVQCLAYSVITLSILAFLTYGLETILITYGFDFLLKNQNLAFDTSMHNFPELFFGESGLQSPNFLIHKTSILLFLVVVETSGLWLLGVVNLSSFLKKIWLVLLIIVSVSVFYPYALIHFITKSTEHSYQNSGQFTIVLIVMTSVIALKYLSILPVYKISISERRKGIQNSTSGVILIKGKDIN